MNSKKLLALCMLMLSAQASKKTAPVRDNQKLAVIDHYKKQVDGETLRNFCLSKGIDLGNNLNTFSIESLSSFSRTMILTVPSLTEKMCKQAESITLRGSEIKSASQSIDAKKTEIQRYLALCGAICFSKNCQSAKEFIKEVKALNDPKALVYAHQMLNPMKTRTKVALVLGTVAALEVATNKFVGSTQLGEFISSATQTVIQKGSEWSIWGLTAALNRLTK